MGMGGMGGGGGGAGAAVQGAGGVLEGSGAAMQFIAEDKRENEVFDPDMYRNPGLWERLFNRGTEDVLNEERQAVEQAMAQGALISPEMYRALGYEPIMEDRSADLAAATSKRDEIKAQLAEAEAKLTKRRKGGLGKHPGHKFDWEEKAGPLKKQVRLLRSQLNEAERTLGDISAAPLRITGFNKIDPTDPTQAKGGAYREAFDLQNETLRRAMLGEESIDPTLEREYQERERLLRERLRRTIGPDYESSSAGIEALANFDREKSEAKWQYNRQTVKDFSAL